MLFFYRVQKYDTEEYLGNFETAIPVHAGEVFKYRNLKYTIKYIIQESNWNDKASNTILVIE